MIMIIPKDAQRSIQFSSSVQKVPGTVPWLLLPVEAEASLE